MDKRKEIKELIKKLAEEEKITEIRSRRKGEVKDLSLINQFKLNTLIPNKWFDWERRTDAKVMIIGQDWGPYSALKKYITDYELEKDNKEFDYDKFLFKTFSSRTEKFIIKSIENSFKEKYSQAMSIRDWDNFFFTMSVLFTRQGNLFRGNDNFEPKSSFEISYPYLSRQIDIVSPKIIIPLGNMAWDVVKRHFKIDFKEKNITQIINKATPTGFFKINETYIIPNYHPASHVDPKIIHNQFEKIWDLL